MSTSCISKCPPRSESPSQITSDKALTAIRFSWVRGGRSSFPASLYERSIIMVPVGQRMIRSSRKRATELRKHTNKLPCFVSYCEPMKLTERWTCGWIGGLSRINPHPPGHSTLWHSGESHTKARAWIFFRFLKIFLLHFTAVQNPPPDQRPAQVTRIPVSLWANRKRNKAQPGGAAPYRPMPPPPVKLNSPADFSSQILGREKRIKHKCKVI